MGKYNLSALDKSNVSVTTQQGEETVELQKFAIGSASSGCLLCVSDGSLVRVSNDTGVIEFSVLVKGSAKVKAIPADILKNTSGSIEFDGELTWMTFMSYPQKLIFTTN